MTLWITLIPLFALALGVFLLVRGIHGRRVDDHPICRRCGFDLFGRPEGSNVCSECGADLNRPHAIQQGRRVRRGGMIAGGATMLGLLLLVGIGAAWVASSSGDWRTRAPVWYLRREANGAVAKARDAALTELNKRIVAGKLVQADIDALADDGLRHQGYLSQPWIDGWGDFIDNAWSLNKLSTPRLNKYFDQALASSMRLDAREQITRGDRLYYWIRSGNARVYSRSSNLTVNVSLKSVDLGAWHHPADGGGGGGMMLSPTGGGGYGTAVYFRPGETDQLAEGANPLVMRFEATISKGYNGSPIYKTTLDLKGTVTVRPKGDSTVTINRDPSLRPAMEKAISVRDASYGQSWNPKSLNVTVSIAAPIPAGIGYDVYTTIGGKEYKIGSFARPARNGPNVSQGFGFGGHDIPPFDDSTIDLVLKPSVDAAIGTSDTFEIWDGQIIVKDVPVKRMPPATTTKTSGAK
jgi:hypothetical protein